VSRTNHCGHKRRLSLHVFHGDLIGAEAKHTPASQTRLQIFFQIGIEPSRSIVAAVHPDTAPELFAGQEMGEDALRVLNDYRKLHARVSADVKAELPQVREAVAWSKRA